MTKHAGHLVPPVWNASQIARLAHGVGWVDVNDLVMAVAVALAECNGYINSYNDNFDDHGTVTSRDVGIWEMSIPAKLIGTPAETHLYDPAANAVAAHTLWTKRDWEPWASFTSGVVFDDTYVYRALLGVMNHAGETMKAGQTRTIDRLAHHSLELPVVSTHQLRALYPHVPGL